MARGSRKPGKPVEPPLDFLLWETAGEDPRPRVEFPEGVDVGQYNVAHTDALGAAYDVDGEDGDQVVVLVVAMKGSTVVEAVNRLLFGVGDVAKELFGPLLTADPDDESEDA